MPATDKFWRDLNKMHVVFAVSCVALFAVTIWMMAVDHNDEWREIQKKGEKIYAEKLRAEREAYETEEYKQNVEELSEKQQAANTAFAAKEADLKDLREEVAENGRLFGLASRTVRDQRAVRDKVRADFDIGVRDGFPDTRLNSLRNIFYAEQKKVDERELQLQQTETARNETLRKLGEHTKEKDELEAELKELRSHVGLLNKALGKIKPENSFSKFKRGMMEWPIIDGFNSHLKIRQDWLPDLKFKLGMALSSRFDRCRTCHISIDRIEAGNVPAFPFGHPTSDDVKGWVQEKKYPHPYATHPRPELYLTSASPHPVVKFGCTVCHEGQGSGTSFSNAAHFPNDPHQFEEWEQKYHFATNHFWEYPMNPKRFQESSCLKCHHHVTELGINPTYGASAPKLFKGYQLIKQYGCFGCHEINGYDAGRPIGPDLRLEPSTAEEAQRFAADPALIAGQMRKVGPSLRHIKAKTTPAWTAFWIEEPKRFRPTTRMPQFFKLTNQQNPHARELKPVELAGIAQYLFDKSQPIDLLRPARRYQPDQQRGKELFAQRGCLGCHSHQDFPETSADFGPNLSKVHAKIKPPRPGEPTYQSEGFRWLYTWLRDPERHHTRTRMPNLFLEPYQEKKNPIDPAADIAAFLLQKGPGNYRPIELKTYLGTVFDANFNAKKAARLKLDELRGARVISVLPNSPASRATKSGGEPDKGLKVNDVILSFGGVEIRNAKQVNDLVERTPVSKRVPLKVWRRGRELVINVIIDEPLNDLTRLYLYKTLTKQQVDHLFDTRRYPYKPERIKGDEIEFVSEEEFVSDNQWERMKRNYVGRRTISRYGCYGCHDIPGFETARPIGTTLQDWGRKDTTKLALEHIEEWLHHHGEPDGSKTHERVSEALKSARSGGAETGHFENEAIEERELRTTYFYESLLHHGRAGFLWQKLRQPRSYDYEKTETKGYDERLRMPKFPLSEADIEAIATFVLGLVAEPPSDEYLYQPQGPALARIEGERLLEKYNCAGCHMLDMPRVRYGKNLHDLVDETRKETVDWFLEHKQELLAGRPVERPAGVQILLKNAADLLDDPVDVRQLAEWADKNPNRDKLQKWLDEHEEVLIASELKGGEHPKGLKLLFHLKPPRNAETGETMTMDVEGKPIVLPVLSFDGLVNSKPDPEDPPEDQEYTFDLWESLRAGGKLMRPGKKMIVPFQSLVEIKPARGGAYAEWLVEWMMKSSTEVNRSQAWQMVPPPLYKEGIKVQTSWLYRFLRDPGRLRHTTVLRMPRFNMSPEEARILANYFPAVDGAAYPYQHIPEREPQYLAQKNQELKSVLHAKQTGYLAESWKLLNAPLCIGCHSVGGRQVQVTDPKKDIRGPNLEHASDRLRPDWMLLWLYKPAWITPYTSMPVTLPRGQTQFKELFQGDAGVQTTALRDALMNYPRLMEREGKTVYQPKTAAAGDGKGN